MSQRQAKPELTHGITELRDLDSAKNIESFEYFSPPTVKQEATTASDAKEIARDAHSDIDSGSESEFPELPPFREMQFSPVTPKKQPQYPHTKPIVHFPLTPDTTPARRLKRRASPLDSPSRSSSFKNAARKASSRPSLVSRKPPSSIFQDLKSKPANSISALEFDRMAEAVMQQVDWKAVSEHVASNRPEGMFKRIFLTILKEKAGTLE